MLNTMLNTRVLIIQALRARTTSMGAIGGSGGSDSGSGGEGVSGGAPPNNDKAPYWKYRRIGFDRWQAELVQL